ncbi:MAG: hypothetical protein K8R24_08095, partial [Mycobacterium sp.]|nr:hypothetical protein [Mycobacterium sp.]
MALTATAARRVTPRACRLVAAGTAGAAAAAFAACDVLPTAAAEEAPGRTALAVPLRAGPRATEDGVDVAERTLVPAELADSPLSAKAVGAHASRAPAPSATASAPTRPTASAWPEASRQRTGSVLTERCAVTDHHFLSTDTVHELVLLAGYWRQGKPRVWLSKLHQQTAELAEVEAMQLA